MAKKTVILLSVLLVHAFAFANGELAKIEDFPYHVSIRNRGTHVCSGALVHELWVITVASCVFGAQVSRLSVHVRSNGLCTVSDKLEVSTIVMHEDFDKYVLLNDMALIKLKDPVQFGEELQPIGLPDNEDYKVKEGAIGYVTGWKFYSECTLETELSAIAVPVVNQDICKAMIPCYEPVSQKMLCAGNMTQGVETCQGDPGAPLMEGQTLIGVLSYGLGCKTMIHPGVYTRVSSYLPWISANSGIRYGRDDIRESAMSTSRTSSENTSSPARRSVPA